MSHASTKVLLVTGAARGIGAAIARLAGRRGYAVAVNCRAGGTPADVVVESIVAGGGVAAAFPADVSDPHAVQELFTRVQARFGRIDALVNNAAKSGGVTAIRAVTPEKLHTVFGSIVFGAFYCIQAAVAQMGRTQGGPGGAIVNVGSEAARFGGQMLAPYAAAKAGLHAMTVGLARELAPEGIRINAVSPGVIDTHQQQDLPPEREKAIHASLPLGRRGTSEEVAQAVLWLLSDEASYVTGAVLPVAGGR